MNITVVVPPVEDFYHSPMRSASLGAAAVMELLEFHGHQAVLVNGAKTRKPKPIPPADQLSYLHQVIIPEEYGPLAFFTRRKRFGPDAASIAEAVRQTKPHLILISCFAYAYGDQAIETARACRGSMETVPIIMGGAGPSSFPGKFLGETDAVLRGEAETTLPQLLSKISSDASREAVQAVSLQTSCRPGPLDEVCPSEEIIPTCRYVYSEKRFRRFSASLSRGCPLHCLFCSAEFSHGRPFRVPPLAKAVEKIEQIIEQTPGSLPPALNIEDDNLAAAPEYLTGLLSALRQRYPNITFTAENGIDYRFLSLSLAEKLISLGFRQFNLSAGIVSAQASKIMRRHQQLEHLQELCRFLTASGIPAVVYAIIGHPGDSSSHALETMRFLASLGVTAGISPFYAVPGIQGFTDAALFLDKDTCLCAGSSLYPWAGTLSTKEMVTLFRLSRLLNLGLNQHRTPEEDQLFGEILRTKKLHTFLKGTTGPCTVSKEKVDTHLIRECLDQFVDISNNFKSSGFPG